MYEYKYVTMDTGGGLFFNNSSCPHRQLIDLYAADGWRYVGYIPSRFTSQGGIKEIDLIFEREV